MVHIDVPLVRRLIAAQFPQWADLPVTQVEPGGWDNRTFRLGADLKARLPSRERYVSQVERENRWLPVLARSLPLSIPEPVAVGAPNHDFPFPWSIQRWLDGEAATVGTIGDRREFAVDLAGFLLALQGIDASGAPEPGPENFYRGGPLEVYDLETCNAAAGLAGEIDFKRVIEVWEIALAAPWKGRPVWVHGDMAAGNLLIKDGRLSGVIDFGQCAVGDPACDLVVAWTMFEGDARAAFQSNMSSDQGAWARARGWALWKALITLFERRDTQTKTAPAARRVVDEVLSQP